jgi:DNA-binding transcriptional LysR family regulator
MELRQLRQLVAVAEELSFRAAAQRLFIAQPALTVAIHKLEAEVGSELFIRGSRGLRVTPAGVQAVVAARRCLAAAAELKLAVQGVAAGEIGTLSLGCSASATVRLLPPLLRAFGAAHPRVQLELREGSNVELMTAIDTRVLDLAFVRTPMGRPRGVVLTTIERDVFCVALPEHDPLARRKAIDLRDLDGKDFIGYVPSAVGGLNAATNAMLQRANVSPRVTQRAVQLQTMISFVASGLGLGLVPAATAPLFSHEGVVFRPLNNPPPEAEVGMALAYRADDANPLIGHFVELASTIFPAVDSAGRKTTDKS